MLNSVRRIISELKGSIVHKDLEIWYYPITLAFLAGITIPFVFVYPDNFPEEDSPQTVILGLYWFATAIFTHSILNRVGNRVPTIKQWATNSLSGCTVFIFLFGFIVSGVAVLFSLLPVPLAAIAVFSSLLLRSRRSKNRVPTFKCWAVDSLAIAVFSLVLGLVLSRVALGAQGIPVQYWLDIAIPTCFLFCWMIIRLIIPD